MHDLRTDHGRESSLDRTAGESVAGDRTGDDDLHEKDNDGGIVIYDFRIKYFWR